MAEFIVTNCLRDRNGVTLVIGNSEAGWSREVQWAIQDIIADRHSYVVEGTQGNLIPIAVVSGPSGPYLRTRADSTEANNLDTLDGFLPNAWDIPLGDTEILAIHAALVAHGVQGQVLMFGGNEHDPNNAVDPSNPDAEGIEIHNSRIYDVERNEIIVIESPEADAFCCGHAFLANGLPFIGGGTEFWRHHVDFDTANEGDHFDMHAVARDHWSGAIECASYNVDGTWTSRADMLPEPPPNGNGSNGGGRWYPTLLTLPDGRILAVAGHPRLSDQRHGAWMPEIYDSTTDSWTYVGGHWIYTNWGDIQVQRVHATNDEGELLFEEDGEAVMIPELDDDGQLIELREFPEGQTRPTTNADAQVNYLYYPRMFVVPGGLIFMASPNDYNCRWYDTSFGRPVGPRIEMPPHGGGFAEINHTAVLLPLLPGENYQPRVLFMGNEGPFRISLDQIDMSGVSSVEDLAALEDLPIPTWEPTIPRQWNIEPPLRRHGCATLLPTGAVFFSGGINQAGQPGLDDDNATLNAEIYFPGMNPSGTAIDSETEDWITVAPATVPRNYHSVALLLPNGRVLTAGSNLDGASGGDDVKEYRIETYSPIWYWDEQRPEITESPEQITYGEEFTIETSDPNAIIRVALMRCGTVTHAWDGDQRYVGVEFETTDNGLRLIAPPDGSVAPPGPYMLWIIAEEDLPCKLAPFLILN